MEALELAEGAALDIQNGLDLIDQAPLVDSALVDQAAGLIGEGDQKLEGAIPLFREAQAILNRELSAEPTRTPAPSPPTATPQPTGTPQPTPTPQPTNTPQPTATPEPTRADSVVGDPIALCSYFDVPFEVHAIGGLEFPDDWIAVIVRATNTGLRSEDLFRAAFIRDERQRLFDMRSASDYAPYTEVLRDIRARGMTVGPYNETIQPGRTAVVALMFQVAPDSEELTLVPESLACLRTEPAPEGSNEGDAGVTARLPGEYDRKHTSL
jgi:hypothetical protein